ncbi:primary-amine oxidase [Conexibacter woesei]|uniref:Amine oxidase n=1 Tax=Conexibacter woesei (strain DSM 14684 / CCUG 47730 / CIP 108061 / JCM 11494 / NBRC 100937 / ID131577) TaxID=469383 RepID=D3F2M7_CONWI|nr:primary-amine oxidase [Conexibacter woesei]ADB52293.1 Primary-amine oxidase [Conexibacter woesei DSM 14684]
MTCSTASESPSTPGVATHPLDPLRPQEIAAAVAIVRTARPLGDRVRFVSISPAEPPKGADAATAPRAAEVVLRDPATRRTLEARVDLRAGELTDWRELEGVQAQLTAEEFLFVEAAVRRAPQFVAALRRRGIEDPSTVDVDPVAAGYHGLPEEQGGRRLARLLAFARPSPGGNAYARPLQGVFGLVDVDSGELVAFEDRDPVPLPAEDGEYRADRVGPLRDDVREIRITQPDGPSFTVEGHEVRWQKWRLRVGFTPREGLVLHHVGYEDDGRLRPVLHRASYAEMVVPYADPDRFYMSPLDIGEFNVGTMTNALTLGCDCLGAIRYFDGAYVTPGGEPVTIPNAICLHEEDDGVLWKHTDFRTGHVEVRRGRRLVISSFVTVGNYEYGFFWYLHQDGRIASEVKATGIVATQALRDGERPEYGVPIAPNLGGINHQHVFCARLDIDVDGPGNSVVEVEAEAVPEGEENPHGNAWRTVHRTLSSELEACRRLAPERARGWLVTNPAVRNAVGEAVAYKLVPGDNTVPFAAPGSALLRRAGFVEHHLWVTRHAAAERYPAGEYPYQHSGGEGLPAWVQADRPLVDRDVVLWYTMNHHHVPRPEDWPVMPVARIGFELKPWGFFDRNPALDVPPSRPGGGGSCQAR